MTEPTLRERAEQLEKALADGCGHLDEPYGPCLTCSVTRIEAFGRACADAATAAERQRRAEIVRKLSNYNTYERVAEAIEREP